MWCSSVALEFPIRRGCQVFVGLVNEIYADLGTQRNAIEEQAYSRQQYDATLDLLERRTPGQRPRGANGADESPAAEARHKGAMDDHRSLIQLARDRDNALRLVTTNFDRIFEGLIARARSQSFRRIQHPCCRSQKTVAGTGSSLFARAPPQDSRRERTESPGADQWRFWSGLPDRALGRSFRQRAVPQLRRVLRRLQHQ